MDLALTRLSFRAHGSWLWHRPDIGAHLPKPSFHLFHGHFSRVIDDVVNLAPAPPTLCNGKNPGPPFQGSYTDVKSGHDESDFGRSEWNFPVGAGREHQAQQNDARNKGKPSHHGLFSLSYNWQDNVREAHVGATACRRLADCLTRPLWARRAVLKTITTGFEGGVKKT
jgi:hypothetical protein